MTSYEAYNAGLPCKNPSCKSHGKPHPNCECYGNMAAGGDVSHFCSEDRVHDKGCKYFAEGGSVSSFPHHIDPELSVASYLGNAGLHGILQMGQKASDDSVEKYNQSINQGHKKFKSKVEGLFKEGMPEKSDKSAAKKVVHEWIKKGGINHDIQQEIYNHNSPQRFAEGGEVKEQEGLTHDPHIANAYPEQNALIHAAKARMSNYLTSLRPQENTPKLAFDDEPDNRKQKKSYDRALSLAVEPFSILDKVKRGTIEPEHVAHFRSLYPEVDQAMQKKVTERISQAQLDGEKPSFHVRQGLSMLLNAPLSAELTPSRIMAAQSVFQAQAAQKQPGGQPQKKTSAISKSSQSYLTADQAAASRQQKS